MSVVDITTEITPATLSIGAGLTQRFTAIAVPDDAPQTFTWTCKANGVSCANFQQDAKVSGVAVYTADDSCTGNCIQISAASTLDPSGCTPTPKLCTVAKAALVTSRVNGTYAFQFSGFDGNGATALTGTFTAGTNGAITSGTAELLNSSGWAKRSITGSYNPITASDPNSNNAGVLTITGPAPNKFQVALDGAGDIKMIETDGQGTGSGVAEIASNFNTTVDQTFAFGFTGVDSSGNRVGYAGLIPMDGSGNIVGGSLDVNDNGHSSNSVCAAAPCTVTGTYQEAGGIGQLSLTAPISMHFDFFVASGTANKTDPLTLYAISTDPDATHPAVSGTMVLQDSSLTYDKTALKGNSVSALTGVNGGNTNVALILGAADGNGTIAGQFDQNNAGTIITVPSSLTAAAFSYTYAPTGSTGRYTIQMLGNPDATPVVSPLPFVLYASGANRGFLLDQSSLSVMTGTINPQGVGGGNFGPTELPGTFGAATTSSATSAVTPIAANLLLTSPGNAVYNVSGTEYPGAQPITGTYTLEFAGAGTMVLTAPGAQTYVIYIQDTTGCTKQSGPVCTIQNFYMMDTTTTNPNKDASLIFAQQ